MGKLTRILFLFGIVFLFSDSLKAQVDKYIGDSLVTVKQNGYETRIPKTWILITPTFDFGDGTQFFYKSNGTGFYNDSMIEVFVGLQMIDFKRNSSFKKYRHLFRKAKIDNDFIVKKEISQLLAGEKVYLINTHSGESDTLLCHYRFVIYSERVKKRFTYSIGFKTKGNHFNINNELANEEFARKLFSYFKID